MAFLEKFLYVNFADGRYMLFVKGLWFVLVVTFWATLFGVALGIVLAVFKMSNEFISETRFKRYVKLNPLYWFSFLYIEIVRGTPLLVQLMILSNFIMVGPFKNTSIVIVASIGVGLNSAAYIAEIIRSGINSLDRGQMEAARALGMPYMMAMTQIILPQAFKNMLPSFVNEFIVLLKETSIVGFIGGRDLMRAAETVVFSQYSAVEPYLAIAIIYLIVTLVFTFVMRLVEKGVAKIG